jgi:hypothetical protein
VASVDVESAMASQGQLENSIIKRLCFLCVFSLMKEPTHFSSPPQCHLTRSPQEEEAPIVNFRKLRQGEQSGRESNESANCSGALPISFDGPKGFLKHQQE